MLVLAAVYQSWGWTVIQLKLDWRLDPAARREAQESQPGYNKPSDRARAMAWVRFRTPSLP